MGSENCAAGAASGAEAVDQLLLEDGAPRVDSGEDFILLRVVGSRHGVAFLTAASVDAAESLGGEDVGVGIAEGAHGVDTSHGDSILGGGVSQSSWVGTSRVADHGGDTARSVRVALLVEGHTDELVRGDVSVQESMHVRSELLPVAISTVDRAAESHCVTDAASVPDGLVPGVADVLGGAADRHDHGGLSIDLEVVGILEFELPGLLGVVVGELQIVTREVAIDDRVLSVENGHDLVSVGDAGLVSSDRDDLVLLEALGADPGSAVLGVLRSVAVHELLKGR